MKKLLLFLIGSFFSLFFTSTSAFAYTYTKADIPKLSVYFTEPDDTEHSITAINDLTAGEDFLFDVWISDVPTGHGGLQAWACNIQNDPLISFKSHSPLGGFTVNHSEPIYGLVGLPDGWAAEAFGGLTMMPSLEGNVPLMRLTFHCEGEGTTDIIPTWHWGDVDDWAMGDRWTFGNPDTGEPGFQGLGDSQPPLYAISGTVSVHGDGDKAGIVVMMTGAATGEAVTDQDGVYVFEDLQNGTYTITPKEPVYGFDPGAETVEIASADEIADFDMYELLGDVNGDSLLDLADTMAGLKILCDVDPEVVVYPGASPNDKIGLPEATNVLQAVADLRPFPPPE